MYANILSVGLQCLGSGSISNIYDIAPTTAGELTSMRRLPFN